MLFGRILVTLIGVILVAILPNSGCCLDRKKLLLKKCVRSQSYLNLDVVWTDGSKNDAAVFWSQSYLNLDVVWTTSENRRLGCRLSQSYLNLDVVWTLILSPKI